MSKEKMWASTMFFFKSFLWYQLGNYRRLLSFFCFLCWAARHAIAATLSHAAKVYPAALALPPSSKGWRSLGWCWPVAALAEKERDKAFEKKTSACLQDLTSACMSVPELYACLGNAPFLCSSRISRTLDWLEHTAASSINRTSAVPVICIGAELALKLAMT